MHWHLSLSLAHVALAMGANPVEGAQALRTQIETTYLCSMADLIALGGTETLSYRYRRLAFDVVGQEMRPTIEHDGFMYLQFDVDGLWSEELLLDREVHATGRVVPRRTDTFHSFVSGELARCVSRAGGAQPTVFLDRWTGVGPLPFFALRRVGDRSLLRDLELIGTQNADAGIRIVEFREVGGTEVDFHVETGPAHMLRAVRERRPAGQVHWTYFDGDAGGLPDGTRRPTCVIEVSIDPTGETREIRAWSAVTTDGVNDARSTRLKPGVDVVDMRDQVGETGSRRLDRECGLEELLEWPGGMLEITPIELLETAPTAAETPPAPTHHRTWLLVAAAVLCATSATLLLRSYRSK